jgi:lipoprotein-anchoring transpeptidase ErfK/SrfK
MQTVNKLSRRSLLKLATAGIGQTLARALLPPLPKQDFYTDGTPNPQSPTPIHPKSVQSFARALQYGVIIRSEPRTAANKVGALVRDSVLPIYGVVESESGSSHNKLWYQVQGGYVFSANVHPVPYLLNAPMTDLGEKGVWAELTIPFYDTRIAPSEAAPKGKYRYYGGTVYKAIKAVKGQRTTPTDKPNFTVSEDEWWYQIEDEAFGGSTNWFIPAKYMRPISQAEFSPLSPNIDPAEKLLKVKISEQRFYAYERGKEVFSARTSTGVKYSEERDYSTTIGTFQVFRKTPSQHMYGGAVGDDGSFDLPGVSWVSYFTTSGIAFHSTYWHNDYGVVRSHGCINVTADFAKWVWRWSMPPNKYDQRYVQLDAKKKEKGTTVVVEF